MRVRSIRVRQFALAYETPVGPSIFMHPIFTKRALSSVKTIRHALPHQYTSIVTYTRPLSRRTFERFLDAYAIEHRDTFRLLDTFISHGGVVANVSERTQLPEAIAFAACKRLLQSGFLLPLQPSVEQRKLNNRLFTTFFLQYKADTELDPLHVCFRSLHIKSIVTQRRLPQSYLSFITMHGKHSESAIRRCVQDFNYWNIHAPMELETLCVRGQRAYAALRTLIKA